MVEPRMDWLVDDIPGTDDPDVVREYIRGLRSIEEPAPEILEMIESAERLVVELERERAAHAA